MSAGKIKGRKITHGNRFLRIVLVQCAWAAARCQGTRFALKYEGLKRRMPAQKALVAIARKLLVVIWNVLAKREKYRRNLYETASEDERKGKRH